MKSIICNHFPPIALIPSGFSGVVEDERASIKNSGDVGGTTNHRDYGSNVNTALLGSPISEATNDTLEGLHLNNGYQVNLKKH